ncbi:MAG: M56 family metallopeptidase [Gemmatimonadetes bacterium]|nr:M56 family metallopeptidase [Gemmatimonadota bacterium]
MIATHAAVADLVVRVTLVLAAAALLDAVLRRSRAALRHAAWAGAMLITLAVPAVYLVLPSWRVLPARAVPPEAVTNAARPATPLVPDGQRRPRAAADRAIPDAGRPPSPRDASPPESTPKTFWFAIVWLVGSGASLVRLLQSLQRRARRARATVPASARLDAACLDTAQALAIRRPIRLRATAAEAVPYTFGIWRPTVVLPQAAGAWSHERVSNVLRHELAHVRRGDHAVSMLARLVQVILWWHPLCHLARHRLDLLAEVACDDLALAAGARPAAYADDLLTIAIGATRATPLVAGFSDRCALTLRIERVLDATVPRGPLGEWAPRLGPLCALLLAVPMGTAGPRADTAVAARPPVRAADVRRTDRTRWVPAAAGVPTGAAHREATARRARTAPARSATHVSRHTELEALLHRVQQPALQFEDAARVRLLTAALRRWEETPAHRALLLDQLCGLPASEDRAQVVRAALRLPRGSATAQAMLPVIRGMPGARMRATLLGMATRRGDFRTEDTALDWLAARAVARPDGESGGAEGVAPADARQPTARPRAEPDGPGRP